MTRDQARIVYSRSESVLFINGVSVLFAKPNERYTMRAVLSLRNAGYDVFVSKNRNEANFKYMVVSLGDFVSIFDRASFKRFKDYVETASALMKELKRVVNVKELYDVITLPTKKCAKRVVVKNLLYGLLIRDLMRDKFEVRVRLGVTDVVLISTALESKLIENVEKGKYVNVYKLASLGYSPVRATQYAVEKLDNNVFKGEIVTGGNIYADIFSIRTELDDTVFFNSYSNVVEFISSNKLNAEVFKFLFDDRRVRGTRRRKARFFEKFSRDLVSLGYTPAKVYKLRLQHHQPFFSASETLSSLPSFYPASS